MTTPTLRTLAELRAANDVLLGRLQQAMQQQGADGDDVQVLRPLAGEIGAFVDVAVQVGATIGPEFVDDRTAAQVIVDYWTGKLSHAIGTPAMRELAEFDPAANAPLPDEACPYPGAGPLTADRPLPGREREVTEIVAAVERWPLVFVTGAAGCGKSSLVVAGVLPALRALRLADGAPHWQVPERVPADLSAIESVVQGAAASPPLVLTVDPVDALFSGVPEADDAAIAALAKAVDHLLTGARGRRVLMVVREEQVARLREAPALARWLEPRQASEEGAPSSVITVGPLSPDAMRQALRAPAERIGLQVHPDVVEAVVAKVAGQRGALRLLQFAAQEIWRARDGHLVGRGVIGRLLHDIETRRWQLEAEWQSAAVAREHAHVLQAQALAAAEARLARREHRARLILSVFVLGLLVAAAALMQRWMSERVERERLDTETEAVSGNIKTLAKELARVATERDALEAERDALQAERNAALASAAQASSVARAAVAAASAASRAASAAAAGGAASRGPGAHAATRAAPAASAPLPARVALSEDETLLRAIRLSFWLETRKVAGRLEEARREYPVSWVWAKGRWAELQLTSPLALAVLFDTAVAQGPLQAAFFRATAQPTGGDPAVERALVSAYLDSREKRQHEALRPDREPERIERLRELVRKGDWSLDSVGSFMR